MNNRPDPSNQEARALAADAYEQLGYQSESAAARNAYLQGASELRNGVPKLPPALTTSPDVIRALPLDMFFDYMAIRLNGSRAEGKTIVLNWQFTDTKQNYVLNLENSALTYVADAQVAKADATLTLTRAALDDISLQKTTLPAAIQSGQISISGKREKVTELMGMLETFSLGFPVVEPRPAPCATRSAPTTVTVRITRLCAPKYFRPSQALELLRSKEFGLALVDLSMPGMNGLELLKRIKTEFPRARVLVLSMHAEEQYAAGALKAGADGYITKDAAASELVSEVRKVAAGGT